ncbi:MAG: hypothetical protein ACRDKY_03915 [Solirubrobacteraceae bacterium]
MRRGWVVLGLLVVALLGTACGGSDGEGETQSFVGKTTSVVLYVNWTREGDELTGSLTQAVLDEDKNTVATKRAGLAGKIIGTAVTLDLEQEYGETSRLTGTLNGGELALEYLSGSSGVATVQMQKADAGAFNAALDSLRSRAEQTKADEETQAAESEEEQQVVEHADAVLDDIAALKAAVDSSLPSKAASYDSDLARLARDLRTVREQTKATLAADNLSVCSSAALVQSATESIESAVAALQSKQDRAATGAAAVNDAIAKLLDDYATLQSDDPKYLPEDAPSRTTLSRAIRSARRRLRKVSSSKGGALNKANAMLKEAKQLELRASSACRTGGAY